MSNSVPRPQVVVIGAGVCGLTAAGVLSSSFDVVVLDKGRGVGGRLATRRIGDATLDHGAQFVTTHTREFAEIVAGWEDAGVARPWFRGRIGPHGPSASDAHIRFRGVATMNAIAKHLAVGLDVRLAQQVSAVAPADDGWLIEVADATEVAADAVVLTAPVPQTLALLDAGGVALSGADADALHAIRYEPCIAVLAPLEGPSGLDDPGAIAPATGPIDWMADNHLKGVSGVAAVTIHATAEFSRSRWEASDEVVVRELVRAANLAAPPIDALVEVQRWRFARPRVIHPTRCVVAEGVAPMVFAGDAFGGAKVEGAVLSGMAAAEAIVAALAEVERRRT